MIDWDVGWGSSMDPHPILVIRFGHIMGLVKTKLVCPSLWRDELLISVPPLTRGCDIHLSFTIPNVGRIEGYFLVEEVDHGFNSTGYYQRLLVSPLSEEGSCSND